MAPRMRIETGEPKQTAAASAPVIEAPQASSAPSAKVATRIEGAAQVAAPEPPAKATTDAPKPTVAPKVQVGEPAEAASPKAASPKAASPKAAAPKAAAQPAPRVTAHVEVQAPAAEEPSRAAEDEPARSSDEPAQEGAAQGQAPSAEPGAKRPTAWVRRTLPGHEHAFWGGVIAVLLALLTYLIGFFRVLGIVILVVIGVAIGQVFDGDPKIIRAVRSLFPQDRED